MGLGGRMDRVPKDVIAPGAVEALVGKGGVFEGADAGFGAPRLSVGLFLSF